MLTLLHITSYGTATVVFVFVTLSLASGLLWLAEVIEEHSRTAKIWGKRAIYSVIAFHILLYFVDSDLPLTHVLFSIACHLVYLLNFANFPLISLTSWSFIASCVLVVADHFLFFFHFHDVINEARLRDRRWRHPMQPVPHVPTFLDIATFFGTCIWLIPLFLFLSLSASDNALPTANRREDPSTPVMRAFDGSPVTPAKPQRSSLFVLLSTKAMSLFPSRQPSRGRSRRTSDGLIAPRPISRPPSPSHQTATLLPPGFQPHSASPSTPSRSLMPPGSPLHSPATISTFEAASWIPVESPSREDDPVRKRTGSAHAPPPRRATSYVT